MKIPKIISKNGHEHIIECSNNIDYTKPLENQNVKIVYIKENSEYEAVKRARHENREYKNFRILKKEQKNNGTTYM